MDLFTCLSLIVKFVLKSGSKVGASSCSVKCTSNSLGVYLSNDCDQRCSAFNIVEERISPIT